MKDTSSHTLPQGRQRDIALDMYRGLAMLYIVCVLHIIYFLALPAPVWCGYLLVTMPIIFFLAGASARLARPKGFKTTVTNRYRRVWMPYFRFALISILIFWTYAALKHEMPLSHWWQVVELALGIEMPGVLFSGHTWFILPYFFISIIPKGYIGRLGWKALAANMALVAAMDAVVICHPVAREGLTWQIYLIIREVIGYNVFYVAGYLLYRRLSRRQIALLGAVAVALFACVFKLFPHDIILDKYPPNLYFISYTASALALLSLVFSYVKLGYMPIVGIWNRQGYIIYLYEGYLFCLWLGVCKVASRLTGLSVPRPVYYVAAAAFIFVTASIFGWVRERRAKRA